MKDQCETATCLRCGDAIKVVTGGFPKLTCKCGHVMTINTHATETGCTRRMPCEACDEQMRQLWYGNAYSDEDDIEAGYRKMAEQSSQEESLADARRARRDRNRGFPTEVGPTLTPVNAGTSTVPIKAAGHAMNRTAHASSSRTADDPQQSSAGT